ncbi:MAG: carboxypeptidase-like regulatory domain-containing protein [Flavisolibacter sp.]
MIRGTLLDENEHPLPHVSITILGQQKGIESSDSGTFSIKVPSNKAFAIVFTYTGYKPVQQNFLLNEGEEEKITILMEHGEGILKEVIISDQRGRTEAGLIKPNPKSVINLPTPIMGVESLLKVFVGSNNELTSQYNVRGGSYDENLIYVNDFEIFRPYLVQSGQQEGLSFINPELVRNINFYTGGFQAKYGDKMSSVLDIQYNKPVSNSASAYISLLEQGLHLEGISNNKKFTYLFGMRNRTNKNLLSRQETQGNYTPSSSDIQALLDYQLNSKWQLEMLGNVSTTRFELVPEFSQLTTSVFSPFFTANLGLDIYFEGREKDQYSTGMIGTSATWQPTEKLKLKWLASRFEDDENENRDIAGAYLFGDRNFDRSSSNFGLIVNPLGAGIDQNYSRNRLTINDYNLSHKGSYTTRNHLMQWGLGYNRTNINDRINEWEYRDSAGYSLPFNPDRLQLNKFIRSANDLSVNKLNGYVQDNIVFNRAQSIYTIQGGLRINYNDLNNELLVSPRINASWKPSWKKDIVFRAALGKYDQPPFYREMRGYDGSLNMQLKAQKSWQGIVGFDYNFVGAARPLRLTAEAYYKYMTDVVPYDIDNVRVNYFGENKAKAYAEGIEMRLFGELVKDAESWLSIGLMRSRENLANFTYTSYKIDSLYKPIDSSKVSGGWYRRPTDRLLTIGLFFQDYLATNKNFKVYLNTIYGSNLPYNIPGSVQYRNALTIPAYLRVDIGFSALLLDAEKSNRRSHSPFRNFDNIWVSLEVFNLIDRENTISYLLIKDFQNNTFTIPNRLTPRLINIKLAARW